MEKTETGSRGPRRARGSVVRLLASHRAGVGRSVLFALLAALAPIATAAINRAIVNRFADADAVWHLTSLWGLLLVAAIVFSSASTWITYRVGWAIAGRLARDVFERLVRQSLRYHERRGTSEAHTLLSRCVHEIGASFSVGFSVVVGWLTLAVGGFLGLAFIDVRWLLVAIPVLIIAWSGSLWLARRQKEQIAGLIDAEQQQIEITDHVLDEDRFKVVKRNALESRFIEAFASAIRRHQQLIRRRTANFSIYTQTTSTLPLLALPIAWLVGRADNASIGEIVACSALLSQCLMGGIRVPMWYVNDVARAWPYVTRALSVLDEPIERDDVDSQIQPRDLLGQPVVLTDVRCTLDGHEVLRGIDLVVPPSSYVALVGPNGAGKTTLLNVITGLITPDGDASAARIGPFTVGRIPRAVLAEHLRGLDSTPVTFSGTARQNLVMLRPHASEEEITRACKIAQILTGEGARLRWAYPLDRPAARLSTGEKVQLLVAQLVLAHPSVLVLDEGLKHLHPTTRRNLRLSLRREIPTVFEVIHEGAVRSKAVTNIVVIEAGTVVEHGSHEQLLALGGRYTSYVTDSEG